MFDSINLSMFDALNAPAEPAAGVLMVAQFSAEYLLYLMALAMLVGWFFSGQKMRRALVVAGVTVIVGLALNHLIGLFIYHSRPFEIGVGHQFLPHVIENSFPSDHGTLVFSVAMGLLFTHGGKVWGGIAFVAALVVAWSRVYLGVHWPLDMAGSLVVSAVSALFVLTVLSPAVDRVNSTLERLLSRS